jgi:hypothetical protein
MCISLLVISTDEVHNFFDFIVPNTFISGKLIDILYKKKTQTQLFKTQYKNIILIKKFSILVKFS